jgi:hypothetical protein
MKAITLAIVLTCLAPSISKPKFKKIDKYVPLYLSVRNLANDTDDEVSLALRKELTGYGFQLVNYEASKKLYKDYYEDMAQTYKDIPKTANYTANQLADKLYRSGTPSQRLTIIYKSVEIKSASYKSFDSIGFSIFKMPYQINKSPLQSAMFSVKEIATNNPDSIALFLISKL